MFRIDQHIEILLLRHDCVIIPDFGGFVVHYQPARFDVADRTMLPPRKTIGFNPQLKLNDSLIIQSYADAYDLSYPEAQLELEAEIQELRDSLHENGSFVFHSIGTLSINPQGNIEFEPFEAGILTPSLYGLSGIDTNDSNAFITVRKDVNALFPYSAQTADCETDAEEEDERVIRIRFSTVRNIAAACIAFICITSFMFFNSNGDTRLIQSGIDFNIPALFKSQETPVQTPGQKTIRHITVYRTVKPASVAEPAEEQKAEDTVAEVSTRKIGTIYSVVLASRVKRVFAEKYIERLKDEGIEDARIVGEDKSMKVVCGNYTRESEAQSAKQALNIIGFSDAWVVKIDN